MVLIIAEKPSLGRNIAAGIGDMKTKNGYMEGNGYIITWAFGHLFSLCDIEKYAPSKSEKNHWSMDNIPCFPEKFLFELRKNEKGKTDDGVKKQFGIIESLCNREDIDTIVNAGDADREGEIIIRLCIENALKNPETRAKKALKRLWLPDQTPQTVRAALSDLKDEKEYLPLALEGFARTYIDWLYGVNLTRFATLRTGTLLRVGRVIVPIVQAIYERDLAIRNFKPDVYLALLSKESTNGETVELLSKNKFNKDQKDAAKQLCKKYNETGAVVSSVKSKKDTLYPGKLYSLSKLQNVLGKKYKMSMNESLETVQKLYERGFLTYPRTNSEYLATAEKDKIAQILNNCKKLGYPVTMKTGKNIFDDSKIESHSALTPTYKIPKKEDLNERERQVYSTVFRRFIAVFCAEACVVTKSEMEIKVGELETFLLKGFMIEQPGWTKYDDRTGKDKFLPKLSVGDAVNIQFKPVEKETSPPKHYTIETLNNYLKNPFKEEKATAKERTEGESEEDDAEEYKAIFEGLELGTEATRTGIIDNARKSGYIELKKDVYHILPDGEFFVQALEQMQITMDKYKTSELGQALKKVYKGSITVEDSVSLAKQQIVAVFEKNGKENNIGTFGQAVGNCPLCGGNVLRRRNFYGCDNYKKNGCKFSIHTYICGKTIDLSTLKSLLTEKETAVIDGFVSPKTHKSFSAKLKLDENGKVVFLFPENKNAKKEGISENKSSPLLCPICHKKILKGKAAYGCAGYKEGCSFRLPFMKDGKMLTDAEAAEIIMNMASTPQGTT